MKRESFCDRPQPGVMPTLAWVSAKRALVDAIRMSHASASSNPPVMATPLIAPMTGIGISLKAKTGLVAASRSLAGPRPDSPSSLRSRPAVKARSPAPVTIRAWMLRSSLTSWQAAQSSLRNAFDNAFIASGRLSVIVATPSLLSSSTKAISRHLLLRIFPRSVLPWRRPSQNIVRDRSGAISRSSFPALRR